MAVIIPSSEDHPAGPLARVGRVVGLVLVRLLCLAIFLAIWFVTFRFAIMLPQ